ncbi:MAG TPA: lipase family protein, partial [Nocardioidaceae bacterium]|nr:lipase family protein [Nocardioidaceae bacterium]
MIPDADRAFEPPQPKPVRGSRPLRPGVDPFYAPPAGFESLPAGTVLRSREVAVGFLGRVPQQVQAWQLLYRTCDLNGVPEATVTTVLLQAGADPAEPRPLVAYQCAIDAVTDRCFPSYALQRGARALGAVPQFELLVLAGILRRGWAISVADHEGMGGYFGAAREPGYRVLDGIRAALAFAPLGLEPDNQVGVIGYSGGGMASAWTA